MILQQNAHPRIMLLERYELNLATIDRPEPLGPVPLDLSVTSSGHLRVNLTWPSHITDP